MVRTRNETQINPKDKKRGDYEGRIKEIKWRNYKTNFYKVPREVEDFIKGFLQNIELEYFQNVKIQDHKFYYYLPEVNVVIDYIHQGETEQGREEMKVKRAFCKKHGIERIPITNNNYKNVGGKF